MWITIAVIGILVIYVISETIGPTLKEGFAVAKRQDIGPVADGWSVDEAGYVRDLRYREQFVDVQGFGTATDFCRAVARKGDPDSLQIACALGTRDGLDTLEYRSRTRKEGFRFSRDDYWRDVTGDGRQDYCRILRDEETGEWFASCATSGLNGIGPREVRDSAPPPAIRQLLEAYDGVMAWYRFHDDAVDYAEKTTLELRGRTEIPTQIGLTKSRGLQLNRWPLAAQEAREKPRPIEDEVHWGEPGTLALDQDVKPSEIRGVSFWVWWDAWTTEPRVWSSEDGGKHRVWIGVDSSGPGLPAAPRTAGPAQEASPAQVLSVGSMVEPAAPRSQVTGVETTRAWVFEIWDEQQRIMRLRAPASAVLHKWQHVCVTTTDTTSWWPTWQMWIDGVLVVEKPEGRAIPALVLTKNVLGSGMRGCVQDFRVYRKPISKEKLQAAIAWGRPWLHPSP